MSDDLRDQLIDLEVKLAYQDRLVRDLDQLVRELAVRLETTERELATIKQSLPRDVALGPAGEKPPHY